MFPTLRQRIGATLLDRIDLALELSTLGAYGLGDDSRPLALDVEDPAPADRPCGRAASEVSRERRPACDLGRGRSAAQARA